MGILRKLRRGKFLHAVAALHPNWHQGPNRTAFNRYPEIFATAAALLPTAARILSFGCSTGEECVTLADYFPTALIIGTDINPFNLLTARKFRGDRVRFVYSADHMLKRLAAFDAVFCMAVLRTAQRDDIAAHYPFERFEERALFLESLVRPGGLFVIHNSTYRFSDTARCSSYDRFPVLAAHNKTYLPDGETEATPDACIFRKLEGRKPARG
jgi:2-polyprenyl-3-methyl-5-hydroxy-6-metoxy-1,4-benzoquinol methylase